ncbi:MAG: hypothetical protein ACW99L_00710 [Promethearchaeota archaeon]|jgi:WD40 repeat protein
MRYKSSKKVTCCVAGDFTRNGIIELIFGSEDKSVKIFEGIKAKEPKIILYYDSWVTACTLGILQLPNEKYPVNGLLIGTKSGQLQLIQIKEEFPDIIWNWSFASQINDIQIGDVTNDGLNEIVICTDDSTIKILNSEGGVLNEIKSEEGRPLSLLIEDIDGDNAKEIIAGYSDGSLKVFHNPTLGSTDFKLKWKTKVATSIKDICLLPVEELDLKHIVFGGYDRTIRNVTDFEWGKKQPLKIPEISTLPELQTSEEEIQIDDITKGKEIPTNIRESIFDILKEKGYMKGLLKELKDLGYDHKEISEELEVMSTQKSIIYEKVTYPVWSLPGEEVDAKVEIEEPIKEQKVEVKHMVIEEPSKPGKEKLRAALSSETKEVKPSEIPSGDVSLEDVILNYLKEQKIITTKPQFIEGITSKGYAKNEVEKEINRLKELGKIAYSRAKPKGWSLVD